MLALAEGIVHEEHRLIPNSRGRLTVRVRLYPGPGEPLDEWPPAPQSREILDVRRGANVSQSELAATRRCDAVSDSTLGERQARASRAGDRPFAKRSTPSRVRRLRPEADACHAQAGPRSLSSWPSTRAAPRASCAPA